MKSSSRPLDLEWRPEYEAVMHEVYRINQRGLKKNTRLLLQAILIMLSNGKTVTADAVVTYVHDEMVPIGGWGDFNRNHWLGYVPAIVRKLKSDRPADALKL